MPSIQTDFVRAWGRSKGGSAKKNSKNKRFSTFLRRSALRLPIESIASLGRLLHGKPCATKWQTGAILSEPWMTCLSSI